MTIHSTKRRGRLTAMAVVACIPLILAGCAKPPAPPPPTIVKATLAASPGVNPDGNGRASPIVVRVFELKSAATFASADFFAVWDKPRESLGTDLVASEEYELRPGESRPFQRTLAPETRVLGVVAAYRGLERAAWRATLPVVAETTQVVTIALDARAVTMSRK